MREDQLRALLEDVRAVSTDIEEALSSVRHLPIEDLGFAKVDHHRALRHGMPEVVFGQGKTPDQVSAIVASLLKNAPNVLITRAGAGVAARILQEHPDAEHFASSGA